MGYAEKRGDYWRSRFKIESGKYGTVTSEDGATIRFRTKREAEKAANDAEAKVRARRWRDPSAGRITFGEYASRWYQAQDLAASTMQNYRRHIEEHLLPTFGGEVMPPTLAPPVTHPAGHHAPPPSLTVCEQDVRPHAKPKAARYSCSVNRMKMLFLAIAQCSCVLHRRHNCNQLSPGLRSALTPRCIRRPDHRPRERGR
jgi:hypothetical protein